MFNVQNFIVSPIVGSIIGYFTNWLAIKMLFLPKEEKRLFGVRLPLTPGLIPKERSKLTQKVAETVGGKLLTPEVLMNELDSEKTSRAVESLMDELIQKLRLQDLSIGDILIKLSPFIGSSGETLEAPKDAAGSFTSSASLPEELLSPEPELEYIPLEPAGFILPGSEEELARTHAESAGFGCESPFHEHAGIPRQNTSESSAADAAVPNAETVSPSPKQAFLTMIIRRVKPFVLTRFSAYLEAAEFTALIRSAGASLRGMIPPEKSVGDILPASAIEGMKDYLKEKSPSMAEFISHTLEDNPAVDYQLAKLVEKIISDNLGSFIGLFLNSQKIWMSIKAEFIAFLSDEANQEMMIGKLSGFIYSFMNANASEIWGKIIEAVAVPAPGDKDWADNLATAVRAAEIDGVPIESKATDMFFDVLEQLMSSLYDMRLNSLMDLAGNDRLILLKSSVMEQIRIIIAKGASFIAQSMDVQGMVKNKMDAFDIDEAEDIILSVVSRELSAITWLGAVLGLIIGFMPGIIGLF
ncbi:MAG: DUF445 family protein [Clostridiales bacterium]|jgi:hypothetical protein|nr:DUF445 family protein [Clostridiales bacterium]